MCGITGMGHNGIANPQQLTLMCTVLDKYCRRSGIDLHSPDRAEIANKILVFHDLGIVTEDGLVDALDGRVGRRQA
jgi:hypothetical protein